MAGQYRVWLLVHVNDKPQEVVKKLIPLIFTQQQSYADWSITRVDAIYPPGTGPDLPGKLRPTEQTNFNLFVAVEAKDRTTFEKASTEILKALGVSNPPPTTGYAVAGTLGPDWWPI